MKIVEKTDRSPTISNFVCKTGLNLGSNSNPDQVVTVNKTGMSEKAVCS